MPYCAAAVIAGASLSFLGLEQQPPAPHQPKRVVAPRIVMEQGGRGVQADQEVACHCEVLVYGPATLARAVPVSDLYS